MIKFPKAKRSSSLQQQVLEECVAMAKYAFASGINIPPGLAKRIEKIGFRSTKNTSEQNKGIDQAGDSAPGEENMPKSRQPPSNFKAYAIIHLELSRIVAPAKPRGLLLLDQESTSPWYFWGPVPLVRQMMSLVLISLAVFVLISLHKDVSSLEIQKSLLNHEGWKLLPNILFLLAASALGASFAALFQANKYCMEGTYDPKYDSAYWVRFVLGLISGLILSEIIFDYITPDLTSLAGLPTGADPSRITDSTSSTSTNSVHTNPAMIKPILAMLGGFSSEVVFRILNRLVVSVESLVRDDPREQVKSQTQAAVDQAATQVDQERVKLAAGLMSLNQKLGTGAGPESLSHELGEIIDQLTDAREQYARS